MSENRRLGRNIFLNGVTQILVHMRGIIVMPILVKMAGENIFGAFILVGSFVTFIHGLSGLGVYYSYWRGLPASENSAQRRRLLMPQLSFRFGLGVILCLGLGAYSDEIAHLLRLDGLPFNGWLAAMWLMGLLMLEQATSYYRYTERIGVVNIITIAYFFLYIFSIVLSSFVLGALSLNLLLLLQASAILVVTMPVVVFGVLRETGVEWPSMPIRAFIAQARLGLPMTLQFIVDFLLSAGDRYFITWFLSVTAVGYYQPGYQLAAVLSFVPKIFGMVLPPQLSRLVDQGDMKAAQALVQMCLRIHYVVAVPFVVGALLVGPSLVLVLTNPVIAQASRWVTPLIALGMAFFGIVLLVSLITFVLGQTWRIMRANILAVVLNIVLNGVLLIFYPNVTVVAFATMASYLAAAVYCVIIVRPHWPLSLNAQGLLCCLLAALVMGATLWVIGFRPGEVWSLSPWLLAPTILLAATVYVAALVAVGGVRRSDWLALKRVLRREKAAG